MPVPVVLTMDSDVTQFESADRALVIISDAEIHGSTRLQKYGFLLSRQYKKELSSLASNCPGLKFYDDWEPLWYGPFSRSLQKDVETCVSGGLISKTLTDPGLGSYRYAPTLRGRVRWRKILDASGKEIRDIHEKASNLQSMRLERLLEEIYHAYPEYTKHGTIRPPAA